MYPLERLHQSEGRRIQFGGQGVPRPVRCRMGPWRHLEMLADSPREAIPQCSVRRLLLEPGFHGYITGGSNRDA